MKRVIVCMAILLPLLSVTDLASAQLFNKIKDEVKTDINNANKKGSTGTPSASAAPATAASSSAPAPQATAGSAAPGDIKVYNNYDFVPGQAVLFEDNFTSDQDGEFPAHWKLIQGQGVMNVVNGVNSLVLTQGSLAIVSPRFKTTDNLPDAYTIEFDYYVPKNNCYGPVIRLYGANTYVDLKVASDAYVTDTRLSAVYPGDVSAAGWRNRWHHVAVAVRNTQVKMYVDQYRVLVDPDSRIVVPSTIAFGSLPDKDQPFIFTNFRLAQGGGMNMIGKKFTDAKIVTHGINFDVDKATLKPESMGTLNMIQKIMTGDPDVKFEVGGHTDSDGDAAHNLQLSQQRADAVRTQLIAMGIDGSRLTAKGYGKTKPIADNTSDEGKANNRRVEFVKL